MKTKLKVITAALGAAVFLGAFWFFLITYSDILLPDYSKPSDKTVYDEKTDITFCENGRRLTASRDGLTVWSLERECFAQDFLVADIDHDGDNELIVLCWKRGRFGKHRPTWVKTDEKTFSQHIFIYEITESGIKPKWMASDIGAAAASFDFDEGNLSITGTDGNITYWRWKSWGLEKL